MYRIHLMAPIIALSLTLGAPALAQESAPPASQQESPPAALGEQAVKPTRAFTSALVHNLVDDVRHVARRNSLYWLAGGAALAAAVHPEDGTINRRLLGNDRADTAFKPGKFVGNTGVVLGAATTTYLAGRLSGKSRLQHLGMDEIEAAILAEGLARGTKMMARRNRPTNPDGTRSSGFSFPSGHATVTFAAATVLQQHLGYKAGIPTYLAASYVAASRLHDNRHYASDVVMGAALGIVVGRSVTYHGRNFWGGPVIVPGGVAFLFSRRTFERVTGPLEF